MLRDRLRQWKCNDKNSSRADFRGRRPAVVEDCRISKIFLKDDDHHTIDGEVLRSFRSADESLLNLVCTPPEALALGDTLKRVSDWQLHITASKVDLESVKSGAKQFMRHVRSMVAAVDHLWYHSIPARLAIRELRETSARLATKFRIECTPLAIMISIWDLAELKQYSSSHQWHAQTCHFLLRIATEVLQPLDPALLLMRQMIVVKHTPEALAMIHEVGCQITDCDVSTSIQTNFRTSFFHAAMSSGVLDQFRSHIDTLIDALDETDAGAPGVLIDISTLRFREGQFDESVQFAKRCLNVLRAQGRETSWLAYKAWDLLSNIKKRQSDLVSEEYFLRRALTVAELLDPDVASKSGNHGLVVSEMICDLFACYKRQNKINESQSLRSRYPHILEED